MKKLLSLTLAFAMVLSLASVAFAAGPDQVKFFARQFFVYDDFPFIPVMTEDGPASRGVLPGNTVNYKIALAGDDYAGDTDEIGTDTPAPYSEYNKELKLSADWEIGEDMVEGVKLTFKRGLFRRSGTDACIEVAVKDMPILEEQDVAGTITVKGKKAYDGKSFRDLTKEYTFDVAFTVVPALDEETGDRQITSDNVIYTFEEGNEEEVFNLYGNMGRFEVNTLGQGDLVISADVDYNKGIEEISSDIAYVYYNGNGATFNKIGTLYLTASYGDHLYKVMEDGTLKELEGNYDTDEEAFKLRTRTLGSFVIAEDELNLDAINAAILAK